jgi:2-polyprenyl-3-methyl-5-hydroxy-6-metoxy-1,4-benzoquinol methylase
MKIKNLYQNNYFSSHPGISNSKKIFNDTEFNLIDQVYGKIVPNNLSKMVDLGCGYGSMLMYLKKKFPKGVVHGVDPSGESVNYCKSNYDIEVKQTNIDDFINSTMDKYDFVCLNDVIEHFDKDYVINVLCLIREKLLIRNGYIMITVPNLGNPFSQNDMWHDYTHINGFNSNSLHQILNITGYAKTKIISNSGHGNLFKTFMQKLVRTKLAWLFKVTFGMRLTDIYYGTKIISLSVNNEG